MDSLAPVCIYLLPHCLAQDPAGSWLEEWDRKRKEAPQILKPLPKAAGREGSPLLLPACPLLPSFSSFLVLSDQLLQDSSWVKTAHLACYFTFLGLTPETQEATRLCSLACLGRTCAVRHWCLEMRQESAPKPQPLFWILSMEPWERDSYPLQKLGLETFIGREHVQNWIKKSLSFKQRQAH